MSKMAKIWVIIGVVAGLLLFGTAGVIFWKIQQDANERQKALEQNITEMKQLQDGIVRSQAQYGTKEDLEKIAKSLDLNLEAIKKDLDSLHAEVKGINVIIASTPGYNGSGLPSTGTIPRKDPPIEPTECLPDGTCPNLDKYGYMTNAQRMALFEPFTSALNIPFGETVFKAWQKDPWDVKVFPRNYNVTTVIGQDEDGKHYTYNKFTIETEGKTYEVPISKANFVEKFPDPSFHINPKVHLTVGGGIITNPVPSPEFTPSLQLFVFSYGKTKTTVDTQWSLLGIGVGFETQQVLPALIVSPAKYNLGNAIPVIENLHIGPSVSVDIKGQFSVLGELSVAL